MNWRTYYYFGLGVLCFWFAIDAAVRNEPMRNLDAYVKGFNTGAKSVVHGPSER